MTDLLLCFGRPDRGFAAAGVAIGMSAAMVLNVFAMLAMGILAGVTPSFALHGSAWAVGVTLGIVMPTLANVVPIRRALSSVLRDALDMYHQVST